MPPSRPTPVSIIPCPGSVENLMPDFFLDEAMKVAESGKVSTKAAPAAAGKPDVNSVEGIFANISSRMNADLVKSTGAVYQFVLTGKDAGKWFLDLKNGTGSAGKGDATSPPDATLTMDSKNFHALFTGKTKAATAFMTGKLKITGSLQKAMKLEKLMSSLKAKL